MWKKNNDINSGLVVVLCAPSGTGKTSVIKALCKENIHIKLIISHTTRPKRPQEKEGEHYYFVDNDVFLKMVKNNEFIEHACVHENWYGTSLLAINNAIQSGQDCLLEVDWQGAQKIAQKLSNTIRVLMVPPNLHHLEARLSSRNSDQPAVIRRRLLAAKHEIQQCCKYDYLIVNDEFKHSVRVLKNIIESEQCRLFRGKNQYFLSQLLEETICETSIK